MTKEQVFSLLEKAISHIDEKFNSEERDIYLDSQLENAQLPFEYSVDSGISKAVILIKGESFVIKIPFYKIYEEDYFSDNLAAWENEKDNAIAEGERQKRIQLNNPDYLLSKEELDEIIKEFEKKNPEPDPSDDIYYYDLEGASTLPLNSDEVVVIPDWDYCGLESLIYELAVEEGLGAYFAEEGWLGDIDNTPIYYQTRCIPMTSIFIDYNSKEYKQKEKYSRSICDKLDISCFNEVWISDFINLYGEEEFKRLSDFLERYEIGDLRSCNIGYLDGAPILFDYTDYRCW